MAEWPRHLRVKPMGSARVSSEGQRCEGQRCEGQIEEKEREERERERPARSAAPAGGMHTKTAAVPLEGGVVIPSYFRGIGLRRNNLSSIWALPNHFGAYF